VSKNENKNRLIELSRLKTTWQIKSWVESLLPE